MGEMSIECTWTTYTSILSRLWLLQWQEGEWKDARQVLNTLSQPSQRLWGYHNHPWRPRDPDTQGLPCGYHSLKQRAFFLTFQSVLSLNSYTSGGLEKPEVLFLQPQLDVVSKAKQGPQTWHLPQTVSEGLCSQVTDNLFHKLFYFPGS